MKIVVVGPVYPYRGGIAHYTARLAQELSRQHRVSVLSFRKQYPAWLYPGRSDQDPSHKTVSVGAEYLLEPLNPWTWWQSARWIRRQKPDLVLIQWWVTFWSPAYTTLATLCKGANIPVVFLIHNVMPHEGGLIHPPLARLALRRGQGFIVHTSVEEQRLLSLNPRADVAVCPFPRYDMLASASNLSRAESRQKLALPEDAQVLLFFGIVRPYKGLRTLLEALSRLRAENETFFLLVAGEFWEDKAGYLAQIEALGLSGQVRLEDRYIPNEELPLFFSAADTVVAPYTSGTQSAVVALALGYNLPLITTDWSAAGVDPESRDQIIVVPPGDAHALAEAIRALFENPPASPCPEVRSTYTGWETLVERIEKFAQRFRLIQDHPPQ